MKKGHDDIGDIDSFIADDGTPIFAWLGGAMRLIDVNEAEASRIHSADIFKHMHIVELDELPQDIVDFLDDV